MNTIDLRHPEYWIQLAKLRPTQELWHSYNWRHSFLYFSLVREIAAILWPENMPPYYFQAEPNLRIQRPGDVAVPWHKDSDFGHQDEEWNCWMPLTTITDETQTVWIEEDNERLPAMLELGEALLFRGGSTTHGNYPNETRVTRYSMDFRLIEQEHFVDRNIRTVEYGMELKVGSYWEPM